MIRAELILDFSDQVGELVLQILFSREAEFLHGAEFAVWCARRADQRAEFHQGLVQVARARSASEPFRLGPEPFHDLGLLDVFADAE